MNDPWFEASWHRAVNPEEKAQALLKRLVTPQEWDTFCSRFYITVRGYRIHYYYPYVVSPSGRPICISPTRGRSYEAPTDDLLGLYLLIRYDYPRFKRITRRALGTTAGSIYWASVFIFGLLVACAAFGLAIWSLFHMPKA
jgi:hypothetical protein